MSTACSAVQVRFRLEGIVASFEMWGLCGLLHCTASVWCSWTECCNSIPDITPCQSVCVSFTLHVCTHVCLCVCVCVCALLCAMCVLLMSLIRSLVVKMLYWWKCLGAWSCLDGGCRQCQQPFVYFTVVQQRWRPVSPGPRSPVLACIAAFLRYRVIS